ncbi:hypothetical protein [Actinopolymorpha pittospori]|uniref:Uncharacterized protein n=1 Tax=Actinopolymorpha pittospori TaxID=648752 RepID=A0A927RN02_9ACTN|nr:hypothetical protein [Actinopolymorpha pittospori]MBE1609513.1 hypothetical protein [Actinopolymorpha pittospori]
MTDRIVAMQIGAVSFVDEGVGETLDILAERGGVNALFLATPTWTRGTGGRQIPGHPLPDHGAQDYDLGWRGGNYATVHPEYYGNTVLGSVGRAPEHPDFDMLAEVLPEARKRGMKSYAWMEESGPARELRTYPNFPKLLEVDAWSRPGLRPCFNNPDYRNWHLGFVEDYTKSYELDGIAWCSERPGPLNLLMQGPVLPGDIGCFCPHCKAIGRDRGIDVRRAQEGYRALLDWNQRIGAGERPSDGAFVTFWRILLQYPEILSWQTLWTEAQRQMYRDIYGVAKAVSAEIQVGWHVYHNISFSPFYRADQDYEEMAKFSDFIKVVIYNNCAGPRFYTWVQNICQALFADADPEDVYPLMLKLLKLDEGAYDKLPQSGFSADYVRRETERAVAGVAGKSKILPGIDIDIPVGVLKERLEPKRDVGKINWDANEGELTQCTPEGVRDATLAAFEGGAEGVVLSRKYSEMKLDNLSGVGEALKRLAK